MGTAGSTWRRGLRADFVKFHIPVSLQSSLSTHTLTDLYMDIHVEILMHRWGGERGLYYFF